MAFSPDESPPGEAGLAVTQVLGNPVFSGGTDGPEGSGLWVPVLLLVLVAPLFARISPQPEPEIAKPS